MISKYYLQKYDNLWWMYDSRLDRWIISDREGYWAGNLMMLPGKYLITECFNIFKKELNDIYKRNSNV